MKRLRFDPINEHLDVKTESDLLKALLAKDLNILTACGGKGLCSTCHVHIKRGMDMLTPPTDRETRTLAVITGTDARSRLACQTRVLGEGVVVELPEGMYIERAEDLMSLLGTRAAQNMLHPINGSTLIAKGKIITRSRLLELQSVKAEVDALRGSP